MSAMSAAFAMSAVFAVFGVIVGLGSSGAAGAGSAALAQSPPAATIPTDRPTRVLAVGDSVMLGAASSIPAACSGCEVVVDAEESRSTGTSAAAAANHGTDWDVVVVLLGHNDGGSPRAYQSGFQQLFDTFAGAPRIVVLTIHEARPYYADVNAFLAQQAEARPNVTVLDWNAAVNQHPDAVVADGLHLTGSGAQLMASEIAGAVDSARRELSPVAEPDPPTTPAPPPPTSAAPSTAAPSAPATTAKTVSSDAVATSSTAAKAARGKRATTSSATPTTEERGRVQRDAPLAALGVSAVLLVILLAMAGLRARHLKGDGPTETSP